MLTLDHGRRHKLGLIPLPQTIPEEKFSNEPSSVIIDSRWGDDYLSFEGASATQHPPYLASHVPEFIRGIIIDFSYRIHY